MNEGECNVVGQTNSTNRHEELRSLGIIPVAKDASKGEKFPNVIFCAPPSGSADYAAEVRLDKYCHLYIVSSRPNKCNVEFKGPSIALIMEGKFYSSQSSIRRDTGRPPRDGMEKDVCYLRPAVPCMPLATTVSVTRYAIVGRFGSKE